MRIALLVYRKATDWKARVRFPAVTRDFSILLNVQTGSGARPAYYPMGTEGLFPLQ
jgi:hypothetical protein